MVNSDYKKVATSLFNRIAYSQNRIQVWRDCILMWACALHNSASMDPQRESLYLETAAGYSSNDLNQVSELFSIVVLIQESGPSDVLGQLFMELKLNNNYMGQVFTPQSITELMASMTIDSGIINENGYTVLSDPASGSGATLLAHVKQRLTMGQNPADCLWVEAVDLDQTAALMAYIQLSLWNVPGRITVGNSLTGESFETWYTPAYYWYHWEAKIRSNDSLFLDRLAVM